jgi:thiol-disulfide isomerase/thioredoxin
LGGAVGVAAAAAGAGLAYHWAGERSEQERAEALWSLQFERPEGGKLVMANFRGKPLVMNFWATWCAPCIRELPALQRFQRDFAARAWQVVALAVDQPVPVLEFMARFNLDLTVAMAGVEGLEWLRAMGNSSGGLPFSVVLDAKGRLLQRRLGETRYDDLVKWAG